MNKWLDRAVGTVGVASGFLLLGGGAAHAQDASASMPNTDPQALRGLLDDLFTPTGGLSNLGLSLDLPGTSVDTGPAANEPLSLRANDGRTGVTAHLPTADGRQDIFLTGKLPDLAKALPSVGMTRMQPEFLPALDGITGGLTGDGGLGGLLGGITGGMVASLLPVE